MPVVYGYVSSLSRDNPVPHGYWRRSKQHEIHSEVHEMQVRSTPFSRTTSTKSQRHSARHTTRLLSPLLHRHQDSHPSIKSPGPPRSSALQLLSHHPSRSSLLSGLSTLRHLLSALDPLQLYQTPLKSHFDVFMPDKGLVPMLHLS